MRNEQTVSSWMATFAVPLKIQGPANTDLPEVEDDEFGAQVAGA